MDSILNNNNPGVNKQQKLQAKSKTKKSWQGFEPTSATVLSQQTKNINISIHNDMTATGKKNSARFSRYYLHTVASG